MALIADITMSLDGFVAGPNQTLEDPLGKRGEELHEWAFAAQSWREAHGHGGRRGERRLRRDRRDGRPDRRDDHGPAHVQRRHRPARGTPTRTPTAGGVTSPRSATRSSCSPTTPASRSSSARRRSRSSPTESSRRSSRPAPQRATRTSSSQAAAAPCSSTSRAGLLDELQVHVAPLLLGDGVRLFDHAAGRARARPHDRLAHRDSPALPRREIANGGGGGTDRAGATDAPPVSSHSRHTQSPSASDAR